jgi:hypothetical protein
MFLPLREIVSMLLAPLLPESILLIVYILPAMASVADGNVRVNADELQSATIQKSVAVIV